MVIFFLVFNHSVPHLRHILNLLNTNYIHRTMFVGAQPQQTLVKHFLQEFSYPITTVAPCLVLFCL